MTITPDQASELLDGATPGPWGNTPMGVLVDVGGKILVHGPDGNLDEGDANLAAAAPDMAETIAGMTEEWGVLVHGRVNRWTDRQDVDAEMVACRKLRLDARLVRRLVSALEVIDGE